MFGSSGEEGSEGGDFLFDLHHADVAFGEVIGERHGWIEQTAQHRVFKIPQTDEQVMPDAAFGCVGQGRFLVVKRQSLGYDAVIEGLKTPQHWLQGT